MSKIYSFLLIAGLAIFGLNMGTASAQCSVQGKNAEGENVAISISCDFPVQFDTGNAEADQANYEAAMAAWAASAPIEYEAVTALSQIYNYNIRQSALDAMPAERRAAILAKPELYFIIPD